MWDSEIQYVTFQRVYFWTGDYFTCIKHSINYKNKSNHWICFSSAETVLISFRRKSSGLFQKRRLDFYLQLFYHGCIFVWDVGRVLCTRPCFIWSMCKYLMADGLWELQIWALIYASVYDPSWITVWKNRQCS